MRQSALNYLSHALAKLRQLQGKEEGDWESKKKGQKGVQTRDRGAGETMAVAIAASPATTVKTKQRQQQLISIPHGSVG